MDFEFFHKNVTYSINLFLGISCGEDGCLEDGETTHTILRDHHYFINFIHKNPPLTIFLGPSNPIKGYSTAHIMLSISIELTIKKVIFSPRFGRTLLSFNDIWENNYHVKITEEIGSKYLCITSYEYNYKRIPEKMERLPDGLYITTVRVVEANHVASQESGFQSTCLLWHNHLGHLGRHMTRHILKTSHGQPLPKVWNSFLRICHVKLALCENC